MENKDTIKRCMTCNKILLDQQATIPFCGHCKKIAEKTGKGVIIAAVGVGAKRYGKDIIKAVSDLAKNMKK